MVDLSIAKIDFTGRIQFKDAMYYVYVLHSQKDNRLYTGYTEDLKKRFSEHEKGYNRSTKNRLPVELIYYEAYILKDDAVGREKFLKSGSGKRYLKKQLSHYFEGHSWSS